MPFIPEEQRGCSSPYTQCWGRKPLLYDSCASIGLGDSVECCGRVDRALRSAII